MRIWCRANRLGWHTDSKRGYYQGQLLQGGPALYILWVMKVEHVLCILRVASSVDVYTPKDKEEPHNIIDVVIIRIVEFVKVFLLEWWSQLH